MTDRSPGCLSAHCPACVQDGHRHAVHETHHVAADISQVTYRVPLDATAPVEQVEVSSIRYG